MNREKSLRRRPHGAARLSLTECGKRIGTANRRRRQVTAGLAAQRPFIARRMTPRRDKETISDQQHAQRGDQIGRGRQIAAGVVTARASIQRSGDLVRQKQRRVVDLVEIEDHPGDRSYDRLIDNRAARAIRFQHRRMISAGVASGSTAGRSNSRATVAFAGRQCASRLAAIAATAPLGHRRATSLAVELVLAIRTNASDPWQPGKSHQRDHGPHQRQRESGFANEHSTRCLGGVNQLRASTIIKSSVKAVREG